jgi:uncharacterized protein YbjT (DUF2867 family)
MHVIFGASGRAGGETARAVLGHGEPVRIVVRRPEQGEPWKALGTEVVVANLNDEDQVASALRGATAAFLLSPPPVAGDPFAQAAELGTTLARAVRGAAVPKVVILSSVGAQHASGTGVIATLHEIEVALSGAAPAVALLRSGYFIETWSEVAEAAMSDGALPSFLELDQKIPMVSTIDVGSAAARLMSETWAGTRIVELGGAEDWSASDVASAFADVLGRWVEPVLVPSEQRESILAEAGYSAPVAAALLGMYEGIARGRVTREAGTEHWRGRTSLIAAVERIVMKLGAVSFLPAE